MTVDQLREVEQLVEDAISRGESLESFLEHLSGLICGKELHVLRPELDVGAIVEDVRNFLWERKTS
jgi:hypothetical protein